MAAVFREPALVEEWRSPGAFLKMLMAVGVGSACEASEETKAVVRDTAPRGVPSALDAESWAQTLVVFPWEDEGDDLPSEPIPSERRVKSRQL